MAKALGARCENPGSVCEYASCVVYDRCAIDGAKEACGGCAGRREFAFKDSLDARDGHTPQVPIFLPSVHTLSALRTPYIQIFHPKKLSSKARFKIGSTHSAYLYLLEIKTQGPLPSQPTRETRWT